MICNSYKRFFIICYIIQKSQKIRIFETKSKPMGFKAVTIKNKKGVQAISLPKNMHINDDKVYLKKVGNALYVIPFHNPWQNLIESVEDFTPDFMNDRAQPENQKRESFD